MLGLLYVFLLSAAWVAWRAFRGSVPDPAVAVDVTMLDAARSRWPQGQRFSITSGSSVGRAEGNTLVLDEDTVSSRHAVFHFVRGRWWLEDLNSTNGTFVNRTAITGRVPVVEGDEVQFGRVVLGFGAPRATSPAPSGGDRQA